MDTTNNIDPLPKRIPDLELHLALREAPAAATPVSYSRVSTDGSAQVPAPGDVGQNGHDIDVLAAVAAGLRALPPCRPGCPQDHPPATECNYQCPAPAPIRTAS